MKKLLPTIIALTLLFAVASTAYAAPGWPTYTVGADVSAARGETVTVPISVSSNPGFTSVGFVVSYNPNVLEIANVTAEQAAMPLNPQFAYTTVPGTQWIHLINTNLVDWSGNGTVVNITFYVKEDAPDGLSRIFLDFTGTPDGTPANSNGDILSDARVISGSVDVSGDGAAGKYKVTYDLNGGSGVVPTETNKDKDERFIVKSALGINAPAGKQFKEWNTSWNGNGDWYWPGEHITMPDSDLTLYAIWENEPNFLMNTDSGTNPVYTPATPDPQPAPTPTPDPVPLSSQANWLPQTGLPFRHIAFFAAIGALALIPACILLRKKKK
ncbi:MAG: cohesin domain-containing protein [Oscillospiraceae bacterium]|nr:cohesin domain-containing protein [Oscillospiraceae bacterium]